MESKAYSVSEVTSYIKNLLTLDETLSHLVVEGEVSNFHHHTSGHMYFTLKDDSSRLKSVMFESSNKSLDFEPEDGQQVKATGYVDVYEPRGEYQLYVRKLEKLGAGELYQKYLELKNKLEQEGLFAEERKQELPFLPAKIGLVTSPTGAAIRDILTVLKRRFGPVSVLIAPAHVQGESSEAELIRGIDFLENRDDIDLIIISRGGGSLEDLWSFNSEKLARKIAAADIPIISGVGHETDFTIADFAADVRAATPSAAAELAVQDYIELSSSLERLGERMNSALDRKLKEAENRLESIKKRPVWRDPERMLSTAEQKMDNLTHRFARELGDYFQKRRDQISGLAGQLDNLSPLKILSRGYSITRSEDGSPITEASRVEKGDRLETLLSGGSLESEVTKVREEDDIIE